MSTVSSTAAYVQSDGSEVTSRSSGAVGISLDAFATLWMAYSSRIPVGFAQGIQSRESGTLTDGSLCSNEHDTDLQDDGTTRETYGLFQMGKKEASLALVLPTADSLIDPENNVKCAAVTFEAHLDSILSEANLDDPTDDVWCYLAWAHNNGIGAVLKSIDTYGLDWAALQARQQNAYMTGKLIPYANAVLSATQANMTMGDGSANNYDAERLVVLLFVAGIVAAIMS